MDFSVDFGTTFTFIAFTDDPTHQREPRPFELDEKDLAVVLLNKPKDKRPEFRPIDCFELALPDFLESIQIQKQEFIPSVIKRKDKYEFPIRTVLFQQRFLSTGQMELLTNSNISFIYQKLDSATQMLMDQEFKTNLKWKIKQQPEFEASIRIFIEELFVLIRTKILLNNGDPRVSKIHWFYPLSFSPAVKREYMRIWKEYASKYMKPSAENIISLTESEAPFYYLVRKSTITNPKTVLTLDIGGGSTDIMVFNEGTPSFGSSVYFGANILWGDGFSEFTSEKNNGIYLKIRDDIAERLKTTELKKLNEDYNAESSTAGSDEIINFWIANDVNTKVIDRLNSGEFRLSYLLHISALAYHSLKLLKTQGKQPPTAVIFSGNGSKYVDLLHDPATIEMIWGYFIGKIFEGATGNPQVILPKDNRKEATCFGGLYIPANRTTPAGKNYLGFEERLAPLTDPSKEVTYGDVERSREKVFGGLLDTFHEFIDWFFEMNQTRMLNFRNIFGIELKPDPIKRFLLEKASESLDTGYMKRKASIDLNDPVTDSLFFYPLVGLIYRLNKLSPGDISGLTNKTVLYARGPDSNGFSASRLTVELRPDSIYTLTIEEGDPGTATLDMIDAAAVHQRALNVVQGYIDPVCEYAVHPEPGQSIRVLVPGKAKKADDEWAMSEKIKIEFY
jgi:hypothetical protein